MHVAQKVETVQLHNDKSIKDALRDGPLDRQINIQNFLKTSCQDGSAKLPPSIASTIYRLAMTKTCPHDVKRPPPFVRLKPGLITTPYSATARARQGATHRIESKVALETTGHAHIKYGLYMVQCK
jgi:hypothetical protein